MPEKTPEYRISKLTEGQADHEWRLDKIEEWVTSTKEDKLVNGFLLDKAIISAVESALLPVVNALNSQGDRLTVLENKPRDQAYRFMQWTLAGMGTIVISLLIALLKVTFKI